jgi:hypothetical protein
MENLRGAKVTDHQLELAVAYANNSTLRDAVNPDLVDGPVSLAINRCFVRAIASRPPAEGESWTISQADVEAELRALGRAPADHQAELAAAFPLPCRCAGGTCNVPVVEVVA